MSQAPSRFDIADVGAPRTTSATSTTLYLGHSSIQVTFDRYGHLIPGNEQEAARLLDRYLDADDATG